jgi:hypothetical protein
MPAAVAGARSIDDLRSAAPQRTRIRRELGIAVHDFVIGFVGRVEILLAPEPSRQQQFSQ